MFHFRKQNDEKIKELLLKLEQLRDQNMILKELLILKEEYFETKQELKELKEQNEKLRKDMETKTANLE